MERIIRLVFIPLGMAALLILPCACANGKDINKPDNTATAKAPGPVEKEAVEKKNPEKAEKPKEKTKPAVAKKPDDLSGTLAPALTDDVKAELKAYSGKLLLKSIIEPGKPVKKGDLLAGLDAPDMEDALANAKNSLDSLELSHRSTQAEYARVSESEKLKLDRAKHSLKNAEDYLERWNKEERDDRKASAKLSLDRMQASVDDQKDELAQLDRLYEGNELAKESQDIVLKRARRRLAQSEISLTLQKRSHARLLKYDIPKTDQGKIFSVESAKQALKKIQDDRELNMAQTNLKLKLSRSEISLKLAKKKLKDLQEDADSLTMVAPFDGIAVVGAVAGNPGTSAKFKTGDKITRGAVVAGVMDPTLFEITIQAPAKKAATITKAMKVQVKVVAFDLVLPGVVKARGLVAKADKVAVVIELRSKEKMLFPGLSAKVTFPEE